MGELLDLWLDQQTAPWAPSTARDQQSRVGLVKADPVARIPLVRLTAVDVDRWHARLARAGAGEGSIRNQHLVLRAAVTQALRWGWVTTNVVAVARLGRRKQAPRDAGVALAFAVAVIVAFPRCRESAVTHAVLPARAGLRSALLQ